MRVDVQVTATPASRKLLTSSAASTKSRSSKSRRLRTSKLRMPPKTRARKPGLKATASFSCPRMQISAGSGGMTMISMHDSKPQSMVEKIMSIPMARLFKGVAKKALLRDLNDIKSALEMKR